MLARIDNNTVIEQRNITIDEVPPHKRSAWLPVVIEGSGPTEQTVIEADRVHVVRSWTADQIAAHKAFLQTQVDIDAEQVRLKYISVGTGMAMTYQEKNAQAQAVFALGETAANALSEQDRTAQFPTLAASVGIEADTLFACAQLVIAKYEQWADMSHVIERTRLAGKKAIGQAADAAAADLAYGAIAWTV